MSILSFDPTPGEANILSQVSQRESSNNPFAQNPTSTASGLFGFTNGTWQLAANNTGVGGGFTSAFQAPIADQQTNALWLLRKYGPNSSISWLASAPSGGYQVDPAIASLGQSVDQSAFGAMPGTTAPVIGASGGGVLGAVSRFLGLTALFDTAASFFERFALLALGVVLVAVGAWGLFKDTDAGKATVKVMKTAATTIAE